MVSVRDFESYTTWRDFRAVASLHAHTHHSREVTSDVPSYIFRIPLLAACFERELRTLVETQGRAIDFSKGWWHPPVSPREVFESEAQQVEHRFDLSPLVSLTDHDSVRAGFEIQAIYAERRAPISFEWTVPFGAGFFHLGVHNLPPRDAECWFERLQAYTARPGSEPLEALLQDLHGRPEVLVVLNHPAWDLAEIGADEHPVALRRFLERYARLLHAVELNGYRSKRENARVHDIASAWKLPLISGGDRHACAPNALLNVTAAESFTEFVAEIRDGRSHVVVMPEYRQHIAARIMASVADVLRRYPSYPPGRQYWTDRVTLDCDGTVCPLSFMWPAGGPLWMRSTIRLFELLTGPVGLSLIGAALDTMDPKMPGEGAASV